MSMQEIPIYNREVRKTEISCLFIITGTECLFMLELLGYSKDVEILHWRISHRAKLGNVFITLEGRYMDRYSFGPHLILLIRKILDQKH
jgi:hypothetical protein